MNHEFFSLSISDHSDHISVVYSTIKLLKQIGFDDVHQHLIASAVSELSTNILRYAKGGSLSVKTIYTEDERKGIEVLAKDDGPGIADLDAAMQEQYSTGGGLGLGLPSVKRIMDEFEIHTALGAGTSIRARKWMNNFNSSAPDNTDMSLLL